MVKWSPSESPVAKTLWACGPSGFGLGTSLGTPFPMIPPRLFHRLSHFARSIEGLMMMRPYWGPRIKLAERDGQSTVPESVRRPIRRVCSIAKWTSSPDCFLTISSVWASDRDYTLLFDITGSYKEEGRRGGLTARLQGLSSTTSSSERWTTSIGLLRMGISCLRKKCQNRKLWKS